MAGIVEAIVPSAGVGKRFSQKIKKPFFKLEGVPIFIRTLQGLSSSELIKNIILVIEKDERERCISLVRRYRLTKVREVIVGGMRRSDSVYNGLKHIQKNTKLVLIHDGVRPFVDADMVKKVLDSAKRYGSAILAIPATSTVKEVDSRRYVLSTPKRERFWFSQTPQVFKKDLIIEAYNKAKLNGFYSTDDSAYVEKAGYKVMIVEGSVLNLKITTKQDLLLAEAILKMKKWG